MELAKNTHTNGSRSGFQNAGARRRGQEPVDAPTPNLVTETRARRRLMRGFKRSQRVSPILTGFTKW